MGVFLSRLSSKKKILLTKNNKKEIEGGSYITLCHGRNPGVWRLFLLLMNHKDQNRRRIWWVEKDVICCYSHSDLTRNEKKRVFTSLFLISKVLFLQYQKGNIVVSLISSSSTRLCWLHTTHLICWSGRLSSFCWEDLQSQTRYTQLEMLHKLKWILTLKAWCYELDIHVVKYHKISCREQFDW